MSFNEQISYEVYPDSSAATFVINQFYFTDPQYIKVYLYLPSGEVQEKVQPTDWTISGKTITRVTVWEAGEVLVARENVFNQLNTWRNAEIDFDRELMEFTMDYITMLTQQNQDIYAKSIHAPLFDTADEMELPIPDARALRFMTFDANGDLVVRYLNTSDIGAATLEWSSTFDGYNDIGTVWLVTYNSRLWLSVAPVDFVPPSTGTPAQWKLITTDFITDRVWQADVDYPADAMIDYNDAIWLGVVPVVSSAPGVVTGEWKRLTAGLHEDPLWMNDEVYAEAEIVNYGGVYYICSDVGGSDIGVAPVDGEGKWERWSGESNETITDTATITDGRPDHVVYTNTSEANKVITIEDGYVTSDRMTVVDIGGYGVNLSLTGLSDEEVPASEARSYIWSGAAWFLASGGGGGIGTLQVPQPKTWVEKWTGSSASVTNQWDAGKYFLTVALTTTGAIERYTLALEIADNAIDHIFPLFNNGSERVEVWYNNSSFKTVVAGTVFTAANIISISRWEDDPDNLPLQTIPADPSLIKDWVEKLDTPQTVPGDITNVWGSGKFKITMRRTDISPNGFYTADLVIGDSVENSYSVPLVGATANDYFHYFPSSGNFGVTAGTGTYVFESILKWEDVAGADAQMSVPVDGWEEKYNDYTDTLTTVPNSWGDGYFKVLLRDSGNASSYTYLLHVNSEGTITTRNQGPQSGSGANVRANYNFANNEFDILSSSGTYYFAEIHKFNSLVNVLHSYHPDPRSVAQKDWVDVWNGAAADVLNVWGSGNYKVTCYDGTYMYDFDIFVDDETPIRGVVRSNISSASSDWNIFYNYTSKLFTHNVGHTFSRIQKYQDSQASDAPRTILDDGFETIYENFSNTNQTVTEAVENGTYVILVKQDAGTTYYTATVVVNNGTTQCNGVWDPAQSILYTTATGVWDTTLSSHSIVQIRKMTGKTVIDAQYNTVSLSDGPNQIQSINTAAGDVAATLPSSPSLGDLYECWNTGTNGNHVTGLPNSIELGDGKGIRLRYVDGWKYEDVIIDEYSEVDGTSADVTHRVEKWAGGKMDVISTKAAGSSAARTTVYPEVFTSREGPQCQWGLVSCYVTSYSNTGMVLGSTTISGASSTGECSAKSPGRWKTGV